MSATLFRHTARTGSHFRHAGLRLSSTQAPAPRRRLFGTASLVAAASLTAYAVGSLFPPHTILFPRPAPAPPTDLTSPEAIAQTEKVEAELQALPLLAAMRAAPDAADWYEARPYANYPEERRVNNLTAGALRGPGKLAVAPVVRARKDESEGVLFVHVGRGLCGHDGVIHGGVLATLLDESLARVAINNLPEKIGVTATLSLQYKAPTFADQFVVIKTYLKEAKGRKASVFGRVEDMKGTVLVEATALFVQPKYAKMLKSDLIHKAMGEPQKTPVLIE